MLSLANIDVVLVCPSHPGNIGAAARSIKTMGLKNLALVKPKKYPHAEARRRSAGAEDLLNMASVYPTLNAALECSTLVFGTSVRDREVTWPTVSPRVAAEMVKKHLAEDATRRVAILFGREDSGLSNEEMDSCSAQIRIDANQEYSSLNLASAVQIICYEMRIALNDGDETEADESGGIHARQRSATQKEKMGHLGHLSEVLESLDFAHNKNSPLLMRKLTRLYNKAELTLEEIQILRGILAATQSRLDRS